MFSAGSYGTGVSRVVFLWLMLWRARRDKERCPSTNLGAHWLGQGTKQLLGDLGWTRHETYGDVLITVTLKLVQV